MHIFGLMQFRSAGVFVIVTLVFLISKYILFNGFNGADDLHYAMLAAKLTKGEFTPFKVEDVFSGRVLLISWQALIYKVAGVSVFTTAIGTLAVVIAACGLTVFKLLNNQLPLSVFFATSLFYFTPVVSQSTIGILPDPYVLSTGTIILVILKKDFLRSSSKSEMAYLKLSHNVRPVVIGCLIAISLLIKEVMFIFLPFVLVLAYAVNRKSVMGYMVYCVGTFTIMIATFALVYFKFTGDPFFRFAQLNSGSYPNPCNFALLPGNHLVVRLTYGIWQHFIAAGFYPVILAAGVSIIMFLDARSGKQTIVTSEKRAISQMQTFSIKSFVIMLLLSIYFPFSLNGYQPLCAEGRQFLFLLPFAIPVICDGLSGQSWTKRRFLYLAAFMAMIAIICTIITANKWQWMIYIITAGCVSFATIVYKNPDRFIFTVMPLILLISVFERLFFLRSEWFQDLQTIKQQTSSKAYYFIDHDNMMHWKLLNKFDERTAKYFNIEPDVYGAYKVYYPNPDSVEFLPGWLIINKTYPGNGVKFIDRLKLAEAYEGFNRRYTTREVEAIFIRDRKMFNTVKLVFEQIKK